MKLHSRILGLGVSAVMATGLLAAPALATAQSYRHKSSTHSEDTSRNTAIALGAAGLILLNNKQSTLGTIALGAAALQTIKMQNDIKNRHEREDRYGYNDRNRYDNYRYEANRYGSSHYTNGRYSNGHYKNDDCEKDDHRGYDWAATRGNKNGWDKNGKRGGSDRNHGQNHNRGHN